MSFLAVRADGTCSTSLLDGTDVKQSSVKGPGLSVHYEGESAAVVTVRRAYSLGLKPLRAW